MTKSTYHASHPAAYLILERDGKICLARRFNTGYADGQYSFPAGHVEEGEALTACIIREAQEEIGIIIKPEDLEFTHMQYRISHMGKRALYRERTDVFFRAHHWTGDIVNMEPHKCDDIGWFTINEIPENTIPSIKSVIEYIYKNIYFSEYGF